MDLNFILGIIGVVLLFGFGLMVSVLYEIRGYLAEIWMFMREASHQLTVDVPEQGRFDPLEYEEDNDVS